MVYVTRYEKIDHLQKLVFYVWIHAEFLLNSEPSSEQVNYDQKIVHG